MAVATGPIFVQQGVDDQSGSAITLAPAKPSGSSAHGLLIARVVIASNATITTATTGWTKLFQDNSGTGLTMALFWAVGNAADPVFTWAGAVACSAFIDLYDDPANPLELTGVGPNTSVNAGSGTAISTTANASTRDTSVFIYVTAAAAAGSLTVPTGWTRNATSLSAGFRWDIGQNPVATSGGSSTAIAQTATVTTVWVQRQLELRLAVKSTGLFTSEVEIAPLVELANGFKAAEVEIAPLMEISDGFKAAEVEIAPLMEISGGWKAAEVEIVALLVPGTEPPYVPPAPQVSKVKAWTASLDGHDMYLLRLGDDTTLQYDLTTQRWAQWDSPSRNTFRAGLGANWLGMSRAGYTAGAATNVVCGDDTYGLIWTLDPSSGLDADPVAGNAPQAFTRVVTGALPLRGRRSQRLNEVFLTVSTGQPDFTPATVLMEMSDDFGHTYVACDAIVVEANNYFQDISWRSLGVISPPGRVFRWTDTGATVRIDGADARLDGKEDNDG